MLHWILVLSYDLPPIHSWSVGADHLELERTLTDPIALAKPFTTHIVLRLSPDKDLDENVRVDCNQYMMRKPSFGDGIGGVMGISEPPE